MDSKVISKKVFESIQSDLSSIVGREVLIISDRFEGKPLKSKVLLANESVLSLDRSGNNGLIDEFKNDDKLMIQFDFKNQRVSAEAVVARTAGGRCNIKLSSKIEPLLRRKFRRYQVSHEVNLAILPMINLTPSKINHLRWLKTDSLNFSSGGMLLNLPSSLNSKTFLLMNIESKELEFPRLIVSHVRYNLPQDNYTYHTGVQFITNENKAKHFSQITLNNFPKTAFEYSYKMQSDLEKSLQSEIPQKEEK